MAHEATEAEPLDVLIIVAPDFEPDVQPDPGIVVAVEQIEPDKATHDVVVGLGPKERHGHRVQKDGKPRLGGRAPVSGAFRSSSD